MLFPRKNTDPVTDITTRKGFERLYDRYAPKLFAICFSRIQHREDAEEIVHDIFRSTWERRDKIHNEEGSIEKYLIRAVKLKTIDYFRRRTRQSVDSLEVEGIDASENSTEHAIDLRELQVRVAELVDQLPDTCRNVYQLSRDEGLSNKEIASRLLISEKTVESHITRALKHFREHLTEYAASVIPILALIF